MPLVSKKREIAFSGPRSSEEFNRWAAEITSDLYRFYQLTLDHELTLPRDYGLLVRENFFLQRRIRQLEDAIKALEDNTGSQTRTLRKSFFDPASFPILPGDVQADVDVSFGMAHGHVFEKVSKVYLLDSNERPHLPHEVTVDVYESVHPISVPDLGGLEPLDEPDLRRAVDGDLRTYWIRDAIHPSSVSELYVAVHLKLADVFSHSLANAITLRPIPLHSMSLLDVWMRGAGEWFRMSTYPTESVALGGAAKQIPQLSDRLFLFPSEDVSEVILYFKQPFWLQKDSSRLFTYGLRELGIFLMRFSSESILRIPFHIPDESFSFEEIEAINIGRAVGGPGDEHLPEGVEARLLVEGSEYALGEQLPALTKEVEVELTLKAGLGTSPLIDFVEIRYYYA